MKYFKSLIIKGSTHLDKYLKEIGKNQVLTAEEEISLMKRIRQRDKEAFDKMIKCNLKFVVTIAMQYQGQGLPLDDLIDEGNLGLIRAIEKYDETKGYKFISYAVWWIRQFIIQAISEQSRIVRLPGNKISDLSKISKASRELEKHLNRPPNTSELATELNMSPEDILDAIEFAPKSVSLNAPLCLENEENNLMDVIADEKESLPDSFLMDQSIKEHLRMSLNMLSEKEAIIIKLYYGIDRENSLTLEEIGDMFLLTRERVRQIKEKAIRKLQHTPKCKRLLLFK